MGDVLATRVNDKAELFLNDGKGGFVRGESPSKSGDEVGFSFLRVDLDNDGVDELVDSQVLEYEGNTAYLGIYTQRDGSWTLHPKALSAKLAPGIRGVQVEVIRPECFVSHKCKRMIVPVIAALLPLRNFNNLTYRTP